MDAAAAKARRFEKIDEAAGCSLIRLWEKVFMCIILLSISRIRANSSRTHGTITEGKG